MGVTEASQWSGVEVRQGSERRESKPPVSTRSAGLDSTGLEPVLKMAGTVLRNGPANGTKT